VIPPAQSGLGNFTGCSDGCKSTEDPQPPSDAPWRDSQREADKTKLYRYVRNAREGTPLVKIVRDVFEGGSTDYDIADYQLANRFFERHDIFKIERRDGSVWVYLTPEAFHLNRSKHSSKNGDGSGMDLLTDETQGEYAKDRAEADLSKYTTIESDSVKGNLFGALATEQESIDSIWNIFENERKGGRGDQFLCIPYWNRFNSQKRAIDNRDSFTTGLDRAAKEYDQACLFTGTTDPKIHGSIMDAVESLYKTKDRFMQWLDYEPTGDAPDRGNFDDHLCVLEWMDNGLPHLHILLFGDGWVADQEALSDYWGQYQGKIVDVRSVSNRNGQWIIREGESRVSARQYLGKSMRLLCDLASMDPGDVRDAADQIRSGDQSDDLWKLALYWVSGKHFFSCSDDLKESKDEGLPHVPQYRYVGTARYDQIPAYIRRNATFCIPSSGLPPPDPAGSRGETVSG